MFEAAELGRKLDRKSFSELEPQLHTRLLLTQFALKKAGVATVILIAGVEGAGKGEVVNRLNAWFDSRELRTCSYYVETEEEVRRPPFWRFWRDLPPRGQIAVLFGSWYSRPIVDKVFGTLDEADFEHQLRMIEEFERMQTDDGLLLIKLWFHLPLQELEKRVTKLDKQLHHLPESPLMKTYLPHYAEFTRMSERALRLTDQNNAHWHLIEASDPRYRDVRVGQIILEAMEYRLGQVTSQAGEPRPRAGNGLILGNAEQPSILDHIDLTAKRRGDPKKALAKWQSRLNSLTWQAHEQRKSLVVVLEGWDAAGKGGVIRRITRAIDARLYKVISIGAPTDEEKARHYLWRFWRHIPLSGQITLYDRSWYGRVLVERVEHFATEVEWKRAYYEINHYEEQLVESGITLCKFWLHIDKDEQMRRFREREQIPWKKHKITEEDWRNRDKWDDYKLAVNDMVAHTSTEYAPWSLIPANDKHQARVEVVKAICRALEKALAGAPAAEQRDSQNNSPGKKPGKAKG